MATTVSGTKNGAKKNLLGNAAIRYVGLVSAFVGLVVLLLGRNITSTILQILSGKFNFISPELESIYFIKIYGIILVCSAISISILVFDFANNIYCPYCLSLSILKHSNF